MNFMEWSKSNVDYGRKLVDSAVEGARTGEGKFLKEESLISFLGESARQALAPAAIGACLGALGGYLATRAAFQSPGPSLCRIGRSCCIWRRRDLGEPAVHRECRFRLMEEYR